jgi:hypothetical protein
MPLLRPAAPGGGGPGAAAGYGYAGPAEFEFDLPEFEMPAMLESRMPSQGPIDPPLSAAEFSARVAAWLEKLRESAAAPYAERVTLLVEIAAQLRRIAPAAPPERIKALTGLAEELERPVTDETELDQRWQHAVTVLESLAEGSGPRHGTAFWKRRG